jgi:ABC-type phosphate transport system auxiliary subunit
MTNVNSSQQLFDKMQDKFQKTSGSSEILEELKKELKEEFDTDFSELSYEERAELFKELQEIIAEANLLDYEKKKYEVLWREFSFRYPPKVELTPETGEKLTLRDQLARTLEVKRYENGTKGINKGFPT